jgi:putative ABC transport system ATP-binding protein
MSGPVPIRVEGLCHSFGKGALRKQILFDITTEIPEGEIVIVTGPSGSGKTTLLTIVSALRTVQEGSVQVLGEELKGAKPSVLERVRRNIGFIFQQHNLLSALTAVQNVELGLCVSDRYKGAALRKRAEDFLEIVGLGERIHYKPEKLSGGQRQRVAIARALASDPSMLMADEPTASLDKQSGREVVDRMKVMAKEHGTTILLVTHDNRILDIADRIVYLEDGRLSTFTDAVIDNSQKMMRVMHDVPEHAPTGAVSGDLDFQYTLVDISLQAQRLMALEGKVNELAYRAILAEGLHGFKQRLGDALGVESTLLLVADAEGTGLLPFPPDQLPPGALATIPIHKGIIGATLQAGRAIRLSDAAADNRFDAETDGRLTPGAGPLICIPVLDNYQTPLAIIQLYKHQGNEPFTEEDGIKIQRFVDTLAMLLEAAQKTARNDPGFLI